MHTHIPITGTVWAWLSVDSIGINLRVSFIVRNLLNTRKLCPLTTPTLTHSSLVPVEQKGGGVQ